MTPCCMASAHGQACDCRARRRASRSIRDRLLALAPHLHPSISRAAEWDQLLREAARRIGGE